MVTIVCPVPNNMRSSFRKALNITLDLHVEEGRRNTEVAANQLGSLVRGLRSSGGLVLAARHAPRNEVAQVEGYEQRCRPKAEDRRAAAELLRTCGRHYGKTATAMAQSPERVRVLWKRSRATRSDLLLAVWQGTPFRG